MMTPSAAIKPPASGLSDQPAVYVAFTAAGTSERHVSLIPHVPGLEALCGQPVVETRRVSWTFALAATTCLSCRLHALPTRPGVTASTSERRWPNPRNGAGGPRLIS